MIDYLDKYGDKTFKEFKFNDIDNLILSQLSYLPLSGIVPSLYEKGIMLKEVSLKFFQKYSKDEIEKQWFLVPKTSNLLKKMSMTKRFCDAILYGYINIIDNNRQFGALSIRLNDNSVYVSYEGTDDTLVGWKEDFKMACNYPVPSQISAVKYLNRVIKFSDKVIRLGGHSKGGNLAVSAAMGCSFFIRYKIECIYNNDGPGFLKQQVLSNKYKKISSRIKCFVPRQSIIGMLMYHNTDYKVIKSNGFGILAHDAFNWQVEDFNFVEDKISYKSKKMQKNLNKFLDSLSVTQRQEVVEAIFTIFEDNDIKFTNEIKFNKVFDMFKSLRGIDKDIRKEIYELLKIILI